MKKYGSKEMKNGKKVKQVVASCLAVVCLATVGIAAGVTNGFGLLGTKEDITESTGNVIGGAVIGEKEENGINMLSTAITETEYEAYGISSQAESAYMLTATVSPATATNTKVTWRILWEDSSTTWSSGKTVTDYVTVTPTSDGALTATVECLQPFGTRAMVIVQSQDNASAQAQCFFDYVKRISEIRIIEDEMYADVYVSLNIEKSIPPAGVIYTDGTIEGTYQYVDFATYELTDLFKAALSEVVSESDLTTLTYYLFESHSVNPEDFLADPDSMTTSELNAYYSAFLEAMESVDGAHLTISFSYTYVYEDLINESKTVSREFWFDQGDFVISVEGVSLSDVSIIF